jgi:hypothetical protein
MDLVRVLVERGAHAKVRSEVFDYELPVLAALHGGEAAVTEVSRVAYKPDDDFDVGDAYRALKVKYSQPDATAALDSIYPNEYAFGNAIAKSLPSKKRAAA